MKRTRKAMTFVLATLLAASTLPSGTFNSFAADSAPVVTNENNELIATNARITVNNSWGMTDNRATVVLSMDNNPGIIGMTLNIAYDEDALTLVNAENGTAINGEGVNFTPPAAFSSGSNIVWADTSVESDEIIDGTLVTLTFEVKENAKLGDYPIVVSCSEAVANDLNKVPVTINSGFFSVIDYIPGDTNGNGSIAMNDLVLLVRYIADGGYKEDSYAANINKAAADVNADRDITALDAVLLLRYIADGCTTNPNGYNVTLVPAPFQCDHSSAKYIEAVEAPSCLENGNIEYWYCEDCDKYFGDEACISEISKEDTITKGEHTVVIDQAVAPTPEEPGKTEGSHCSTCGEILIKQEVVSPPDDDYSITYNIVGSDTYLATLDIQNPNPAFYSAGDSFRLKELKVPGYTFKGWFDGQGENANRLTVLSSDDYGDVELYAHWEVVPYQIDFDTDITLHNPENMKVFDSLILPSLTYTVDRGTPLPNLSHNGYYFMGWADENDNLVKSVPKGSYGHMKLYPIWASHRNSTHPNDYVSEGAASITEWNDEDGNTNISFVYNIGTIENVPLYQLGEWMHSSGIKEKRQETITDSYSKECTENIVKAISEATTNSSSWTLSKEWNETIDRELVMGQQLTSDQRLAAEIYWDDNKAWSIGAGIDGGKTVTNTNGTSNKINIGAKIGGEIGRKISATIPIKGIEIGAEKIGKLIGELTGSYEKGTTHEKAKTNSFSWNVDGSYSSSEKNGGSVAFSDAISQSLSQSERYGEIFTTREGEIKTNEIEQSSSVTDSYSNSFAYSTQEVTETFYEYTNEDAPDGYYRRVMVGKACVFAVVTYNFATCEYSVNTISAIDDKSYNTYWDYSASSSDFTDHQDGVLPFAVPYEVNEYIGKLTLKTDGLTVGVGQDTGIVNGYTGTDNCVIIPQYVSYDNQEQNSYLSVKVTGIKPDTFAGNKDIVAVFLPDSVTEIPAGAFKGCPSLKAVVGRNIKNIGTRAFQNCTSLESFIVGPTVESIGIGAFENAGKVTFNATNTAIVEAACKSGAKSIILNLKECTDPLESLSLSIPNTTDYFKLEGSGKTLTNVQIVSDAVATDIQNVVMNNTIGRPLTTSSESLTIGTTKITAPDLAIVLLTEDTNITVYGQSSIATKGENAILSHNEVYSGTGNTDIARVNITGNIAVCGSIEGEQFVRFESGKINKIDEDEFEQLLNYIVSITLNKTKIKLNTDGTSKTYQLVSQDLPSDINVNDIVWASSDPSVASVSNNGLVTGLKDGTAIITASLGGGSASCDITVKTAYTESKTAKTDWSKTKPEELSNRKIYTEQRPDGERDVSMNLAYYCTRTVGDQIRQFRPNSVNVAALGLDTDYGENSTQNVFGVPFITKSMDEIAAAKVIQPGQRSYGDQWGYNRSDTQVGYDFENGCIWFEVSRNKETIYATWYCYEDTIQVPVVYEN